MVADAHLDLAVARLRADGRRVPVLDGVVHQVGEQPVHGQRAHPQHGAAALLELDRVPGLGRVPGHALQQRIQVQHHALLDAPGTAGQLQPLAHQRLHRRQVGDQPFAQRFVGHVLQPQPQPGERRLQVVGDGREHLRALADMPLQALLHGVEGFGRAPHLLRPGHRQWIALQVLAQLGGGVGEPLQRRTGDARHHVGEHGDGQRQQRQEQRIEGEDADARRRRVLQCQPQRGAIAQGQLHQPAARRHHRRIALAQVVRDARALRQQLRQRWQAGAEAGDIHPRIGHRPLAVVQDRHQRQVLLAGMDLAAGLMHARAAGFQQPRAQLGVALKQGHEALQAIGHAHQVLLLELLAAVRLGQQGGADRRGQHADQQDDEQPPRHRGQEPPQPGHHASVTTPANT